MVRIGRAVRLLERTGRSRILCHYDPDGAAAAAILAKTLARKGIEFQITLSASMDENTLSKLSGESSGMTIIADMGSSHLERLEEFDGGVLVLDHHQPKGDSEKVVHVNPHVAKIDGTREVCGASLALMLSIAVDESNWDMAGIAMAGAIGDRQHVGGFDGLNSLLFQDAVNRKVLIQERQLSLRDLPLADALAHSLSPYFVGLTGRSEKCVEFLGGLGIEADASLRKLEANERRSLITGLAIRLIRQGTQPEAMRTLVDEKYWIPQYGLYAEELSAYVNSCSRLGHEGLGVCVALGDKASLREAEGLREDYFNQIIKYLHELEKGMFTRKHLQFFYCPEPTLAGAVAGIGMQYFFDGKKPVLAFSVLEDTTKVSSRATRRLVSQGLNLAVALSEAASMVEGRGGGHNIAAGANIAKGKEEKFLSLLDEIISTQLKIKIEG